MDKLRPATEEELTKFTGGAHRVDVDTTLDLVCPFALEAVASIFGEGEIKYGAYNWTKGLPIFDIERHMTRHYLLWKKGDRSEPHMAKVAWGAFVIMHYEGGCNCGQIAETRGIGSQDHQTSTEASF